MSVSPDPVSNTRVNSTDLPMLLRRRIPDSSSSLIDLRCSFPNGRCSPIRISPDVTIQTTLRSNSAAPSRRHPNSSANSAAMPSHWSLARWARPGRAIRHTTMAMPARTSRSLSDVPLRSLTSFSFAAASIVGGKHHDRRGRVKRQRVADKSRLRRAMLDPAPAIRCGPFSCRAAHEPDAKNRATRRGASRPGRWRSWRLGKALVGLEIQRGVSLGARSSRVSHHSYRGRVFPGDVANCFICFVGGNLCPPKPTRFFVPNTNLTY